MALWMEDKNGQQITCPFVPAPGLCVSSCGLMLELDMPPEYELRYTCGAVGEQPDGSIRKRMKKQEC